MQRGKTTRITVYADLPTSVSSSLYGANLDCFAFNMNFIASRSPELAKELMRIYQQCKKLRSK